MDFAQIESTIFNPMNLPATKIAERVSVPISPAHNVVELTFEIGLWFSGLESFLAVGRHSLVEETPDKAIARSWQKEFRLTHSTLLRCSKLLFQLGKSLREESSSEDFDFDFETDATKRSEFTGVEIHKLSQTLKDLIALNETLLRAAPLKFSDWTAWSRVLNERLNSVDAFAKLIAAAEAEGERFLPAALQELLENRSLPLALKSDLLLILPRFGKILKWLNVIEEMLKEDESLKSALLIFARIQEQIREMISYVNHRLLRIHDEDGAIFGMLDGAAYAASIELRKVYNHELAGFTEIRQAPLLYARTETAFSLLNDSFQQTLVTFAQLIEPEIEPTALFPNFQSKLKQSLILRQNLWNLFQSVKQAEQNPKESELILLHKQATDFLSTTLHFLFYKDMETIERFIEEALITSDKKDLVPILHRFGAYLETLFGQINMRAALVAHPFES